MNDSLCCGGQEGLKRRQRLQRGTAAAAALGPLAAEIDGAGRLGGCRSVGRSVRATRAARKGGRLVGSVSCGLAWEKMQEVREEGRRWARGEERKS